MFPLPDETYLKADFASLPIKEVVLQKYLCSFFIEPLTTTTSTPSYGKIFRITQNVTITETGKKLKKYKCLVRK